MAIPHRLAIRLLFLLILPILWALPGGHLPTLLAHPELPGQLQCFARCVAKCLVEDGHKSLSQCQTDCRQYGQPSLCGPQELARGKRGRGSSSSREHQDHRHGRHPPPPKLSKNGECWARCKDLGLPPPSPPPPPPSELQAQFNENLTIDIHWKLTGPGAEKDRLFLIQLVSEVPNRQISQIFTQKASGYSGLALASAESICGPVSVQVAAVDAARGLGPMSKPVQLEGSGPRVPARMQLFATKFNSTPFETDDYEVNGTLDVELQFQLNGWPFGLEDVEVNPVFHLVGCAEPDLSQAMPAPEFEPGTQPNTVLTHLGADMMYRRCRFVYAVEEVRSNKCGRQYPVVAGQHDFQSIEFSCDTVEDSTLAPGNVCTRQKQGQPPVCGQFDKFRYSVIEESNDSATREERLSVNITFLPLQRVLQQKPKYYVAIYGNAIKSPNRNNLERLIAGVNMTDVLGEMTNCAKFAADKSCLRFYSDNSIILDGLKRNTSYGVVLCAVLDPANLTFPPMIGADKSRKPQAFGLYLPAKGQHRHPGTGSSQEGGGDGADDEEADTEEEEEEHKRKKAEEFKAKRVVRLLVAGAVLLVALLLLSVGIIFCWLRRQKEHLRKKRLNLEAMRRGREQRYTDFPSRRDDPWELERRNLILYEDKRLGAGAFGSVYLGKLVGIRRQQQQQGAGGSSGNSHNNNLSIGLLRAENTFVAVKMLPEYADEPSKSDFLREIGLMKTLGYHERLVNMLACVTQSEPYCLVVEFCSDGDLLQFLRHRCKYMLELEDAGVNYSDPECDADFDRTMIMTVKQLLMFAVQISYGLEYLSQKGFVHRDVAARNILVHEKTHAKIGDFGLCRFIYADSSNYKGRGGRLPIKWMSPEAIRHYEFTTSSDVWSFGVLMFEIITLGGTPYPGIQPDDMLAFLESGQRIVQPDNCPDEYYKVMHACWAADPRIRPDFGAVRQQLALQLENVSDEYAYLKLDAKKDYYNVSYGELKAQRGENVEEDLRKAAEEEAKKEKRTKEKTEDEDEEKDEKDENDEEKDENDEEEREVKEGGAEEKKEDEKEDENGSSQMNPTQTRHHNVGIGIGNGIGIGLSSRERKEQQQQQLGAAGAEELVKVAA